MLAEVAGNIAKPDLAGRIRRPAPLRRNFRRQTLANEVPGAPQLNVRIDRKPKQVERRYHCLSGADRLHDGRQHRIDLLPVAGGTVRHQRCAERKAFGRIDGQSLLVARRGLRGPVELGERMAADQISVGKLRIVLQRCLAALQRVLVTAEGVERKCLIR
jgi:hypothetical protein